jgi:filamentous hemagglutinin family protein
MKKIFVFLFLSVSVGLFSNPTLPSIAQGTVQVTSTDQQLQIQASDGSVINWESFSIAPGEVTQFIQPSADSSVLNRVVGLTSSQILGQLQANGNVLLLNPNGILIGKDARIDVGGFLASTLNLSSEDFIQKGNLNFTGNSLQSIENLGTIQTSNGDVTLLAHIVQQNGIINAATGKVAIGVGCQILLQPGSSPKILIQTPAADDAITINGQISALKTELQAEGNPYAMAIKIDGQIATTTVSPGGQILISSGNASTDIGGSLLASSGAITISSAQLQVENKSSVSAPLGTITISGASLNNNGTISAPGGSLALQSQSIIHAGTLDVSADTAGTISINANSLLNSGKTLANSTVGQGGTITIQTQQGIIETTSALISANGQTAGGQISSVVGNGYRLFTSGNYQAQGQTTGGSITLAGQDLCLSATQINASGQTGGGQVLVGGDGANSQIIQATNLLSESTDVKADALPVGLGKNPPMVHATNLYMSGSASVKADALTQGNGGKVVFWSDENAAVLGSISSQGGAQSGDGGYVEVSGQTSLTYSGNITNSAPNGQAGTIVLIPSNTTPTHPQYEFMNPDPAGGGSFGTSITPLFNGNEVITNPGYISNAGAVYLFDGATAGLISALTGANANDHVGSGGITLLPSGNFLVQSPSFANGVANAGAVTYCSAITGTNGLVGSSNSLVGSFANDTLGSGSINFLPNGNYLIQSPNWNSNMGAITSCNADGSTVGAISSSNSLIGSLANDALGSGGIISLSNGNFLVMSPNWNNAMGAVTYCNANGTTLGQVSASNSLVGALANDSVGSNGIVPLSNGNFLVMSPNWNSNMGAITYCNGNGTTLGQISAANSLVGTNANDRIGIGGIIMLPNQNYVVVSPYHNSIGAVTLCNSGGTTLGAVSSANSLVGSYPNDQVGSGGIFILSNGNYLVLSPACNNASATLVGAVTYCQSNGTTIGQVSVSNSLMGSSSNDQVGSGGITLLTNCNYLVKSPNWNSGAGAVSCCNINGTTVGQVSSSNSLTGSAATDTIGSGGITVLSNGNYVVRSPNWTNNTGAVTYCNSNGTTVGQVSSSNSLTGSASGDKVGSGGVMVFPKGNYLVRSLSWNANTGAITYCKGDGSTVGSISSSNSLVGSTAGDAVGLGGITFLPNGNFLVKSPNWNANTGAITYCNTGMTGEVNASNSLVGSVSGDAIGSGGITLLANRNFVVQSPKWNAQMGAVTYCNGDGSTMGTVTSSNSLIGTTAGDMVGSNGFFALSNGDSVIVSSNWNNHMGAITYYKADGTTVGEINASNSLIGTQPNDFVGIGGLIPLSNGNYLVKSPNWGNGSSANAGAVTYYLVDGTTLGNVSSQNSVVGQLQDAGLSAIVIDGQNEIFICPFTQENGGTVRAGQILSSQVQAVQ